MATEASPQTPLMKQYTEIKAKYPHAFLFFRLGDFYEMFFDDAKKASALLGLVLTKRNGTPMCGVPYHSSSTYIARLLKEGKKVAVCEQVEDAADAKNKLVKREVVRVITPATITEDELLDSDVSNHLVCIHIEKSGWALACIDVSTGDFWVTEKLADENLRFLSTALTRTNYIEILADKNTAQVLKNSDMLNSSENITVIKDGSDVSAPNNWKDIRITKENKTLSLKAALSAKNYVEENEPQLKDTLIPSYRENTLFMHLDENAVKTLELVENQNGTRADSLWSSLNNCATPMGSRMLREWILHPLMDKSQILNRQKNVEYLLDGDLRTTLKSIIETVSDIERVITRISAKSASPRDIGGLRDSLIILKPLSNWLKNSNIKEIPQTINNIYDELDNVYNLLSAAILENPPAKLGDGKIIKTGYNTQLDELYSIKENSNEKLKELQASERKSTGISSLKIGYNSVFGYYIDVTKTHISKVPYHYIRKQTLVNSERFITEDLKEMESKILGAEDRILRLEKHLFNEIRNKVSAASNELKTFAKCIAELDVYFSLAAVSERGQYIKPVIDDGHTLEIIGGRHPIVEKNMASGEFVPNDINMGADFQIMIITGPNMSGKSVYLRQNALLIIMAQIGSFIPAEKARIAITDRIMTRIGARDILSKGQSTFMVEMKETAGILDCATSKTLVLLDEVGRGTSTFDGVSIAWAVTEHLYDLKKGPKVLFATHYFELTELEEKYSGIKNFNVKVEEIQKPDGKTELAFLHKVAKGPSDKSYGICVAELAGISPSCILRARQILKNLEAKTNLAEKSKKEKLPLIETHPVIDELKDCILEKLTPLEALEVLTRWKKRL